MTRRRVELPVPASQAQPWPPHYLRVGLGSSYSPIRQSVSCRYYQPSDRDAIRGAKWAAQRCCRCCCQYQRLVSARHLPLCSFMARHGLGPRGMHTNSKFERASDPPDVRWRTRLWQSGTSSSSSRPRLTPQGRTGGRGLGGRGGRNMPAGRGWGGEEIRARLRSQRKSQRSTLRPGPSGRLLACSVTVLGVMRTSGWAVPNRSYVLCAAPWSNYTPSRLARSCIIGV